MLAHNVVGQRFMPFVTELSKDVLEETAEEKMRETARAMDNFQWMYEDASSARHSQRFEGMSYLDWEAHIMTPEIKNQVLALGKEGLEFFRQGKHLFMYRKYVDAVEAFDIAMRKLKLGLEILGGILNV